MLGGMSTATDMLAAYLAAEAAVLLGKEARIGDKTFRSEDLQAIRDGRQEWERKVAAEQGRSARAHTLGGLAIRHARLT
jgi:hypothetical protein